MEKYIFDKCNGLWYELQGDYYIPCLMLNEPDTAPIGMWGRKHQQYLKEHRPWLYSRLLLSGKLYDDLNEVDAEAQRLLDQMIPQMAAEAGVDEELKTADPMKWVGIMNTIKAQVEEIICNNVVFL